MFTRACVVLLALLSLAAGRSHGQVCASGQCSIGSQVGYGQPYYQPQFQPQQFAYSPQQYQFAPQPYYQPSYQPQPYGAPYVLESRQPLYIDIRANAGGCPCQRRRLLFR